MCIRDRGRRRKDDDYRQCRNRAGKTESESGSDRYRYRPSEPGRGNGPGEPHRL